VIRHYHKFASYRVRGLGIYFNFNYRDIPQKEKERISEFYAEYTSRVLCYYNGTCKLRRS